MKKLPTLLTIVGKILGVYVQTKKRSARVCLWKHIETSMKTILQTGYNNLLSKSLKVL